MSRIRTNVALAAAPLTVALSLFAGRAHAEPPEIPIVPGVTFVIAVNDATPAAGSDEHIVQGDYEMIVAITGVTADEVTQTAYIDGFDAAGVRRRGSIPRVVSAAELASSHVQVLGFHSSDPPRVSGTTSLGPSLKVTRDLVQTGSAAYSFRNFTSRGMASGTLHRSAGRVRFPVLLNGRRVELDAIHATGLMSLGSVSRPLETVILDHPRYPLTLRIAYGPRGGAYPFTPDFAREIVRIDLPTSDAPVAAALEKDCRIELQGIYFDFNQATIKPESDRALREIAAALEAHAGRRFVIEGHTDDVGSDRYNDDLSARRAAAVRTALVRDFGLDAARLSTAGHGERRPIESNGTLAGRARNRRVELVCAEDR